MKNAFNKKFLKRFLIVASPMILQQFLAASVQLIDNFMVGELGESAISAVASVNQVFFIGMLMIFGITGGAGIYTAQYFGDKDFDKLKQSYRLKIVCSLAIAFIIVILALGFKELLASAFLEVGSESYVLAIKYMSIAVIGVIPMAINGAVGSTFREVARPIYATYATITSILLNTVLNYLLIFGHFGFPELGVSGAAIATVIARSVESIIMLIMVKLNGHEFSTRLRDLFKIDRKITSKIFEKALPLTLNEMLWSGGMTALFYAYSLRGAESLAGHSIAYTVFQLAFVLFGGIGVAVSVMVGNELGADNIEEAKNNSFNIMVIGTIIAVIMGILVLILSERIIGIYNINEVAYQVAKRNLRTLALIFPVIVVNLTIFFSMRAGGDTKSTLIMDAIFTWVGPVPLALGLALYTDLPVYTMFFFVNLLEILKMVVAIIRYRQGSWLNNLTKA